VIAAVTDFAFGHDTALIDSVSIVVTGACALGALILTGGIRGYAELSEQLGH
jgi:hypothetical protein